MTLRGWGGGRGEVEGYNNYGFVKECITITMPLYEDM